MNDFEIHSTPNMSRENKIKNNSDETNITEDSGVQITPTSTKCSKSDNDIMSFLQQQFNVINVNMREQNNKFNELNNRLDNNEKKFETKFDVMSIDKNKRFDTNDAKFDVLTNSLCSTESKLNEICSEIKRETDESRESVCVIDNKADNKCESNVCLLYTSRCV